MKPKPSHPPSQAGVVILPTSLWRQYQSYQSYQRNNIITAHQGVAGGCLGSFYVFILGILGILGSGTLTSNYQERGEGAPAVLSKSWSVLWTYILIWPCTKSYSCYAVKRKQEKDCEHKNKWAQATWFFLSIFGGGIFFMFYYGMGMGIGQVGPFDFGKI